MFNKLFNKRKKAVGLDSSDEPLFEKTSILSHKTSKSLDSEAFRNTNRVEEREQSVATDGRMIGVSASKPDMVLFAHEVKNRHLKYTYNNGWKFEMWFKNSTRCVYSIHGGPVSIVELLA